MYSDAGAVFKWTALCSLRMNSQERPVDSGQARPHSGASLGSLPSPEKGAAPALGSGRWCWFCTGSAQGSVTLVSTYVHIHHLGPGASITCVNGDLPSSRLRDTLGATVTPTSSLGLSPFPDILDAA